MVKARMLASYFLGEVVKICEKVGVVIVGDDRD